MQRGQRTGNGASASTTAQVVSGAISHFLSRRPRTRNKSAHPGNCSGSRVPMTAGSNSSSSGTSPRSTYSVNMVRRWPGRVTATTRVVSHQRGSALQDALNPKRRTRPVGARTAGVVEALQWREGRSPKRSPALRRETSDTPTRVVQDNKRRLRVRPLGWRLGLGLAAQAVHADTRGDCRRCGAGRSSQLPTRKRGAHVAPLA